MRRKSLNKYRDQKDRRGNKKGVPRVLHSVNGGLVTVNVNYSLGDG
jgi:hypothetical protein